MGAGRLSVCPAAPLLRRLCDQLDQNWRRVRQG